eukprot:TRINITY_DN1093_c0_g2_i1.p1 TRINITY_DN1093_c0_g2~~TRINITY_DN1093_c0_g2_i1.p1  ORF type:complete len:649 (+),score=207.17 TRINITY_DN1093_c0_g2_i1:167-2113(+)
MVVYNFKTITVVPTGKDLVDIVLSKTQRKTPTIIHPTLPIARIRRFYMRKVKFASQTFHDKLASILEEFPILDDIHPFYGDLMNVLYDKDHYKLALGQINTAKHLIDNIAKDYLKLLKYGDSLYRCKQLKKAALGRMCTLMSRQNASLAYLEQVRQHLARLPSIDPGTRTLILTGFPNVGKSSFLNKITRANVDVQPYPFTTKSLFVGHTDYQYLRWQVIDSPGILDHPLEERNTIEMQSITALAHLRAAILYLIDISEQCGYSIKQQVDLFNSLKTLFVNKPVIVVANKIDVVRLDQLKPEDKALLDSIITKDVTFVTMSNMSEEGISAVKQIACDKLLEQRVEAKIQTKKSTDFLARLHVAVPPPRDDKTRPPMIPESVLLKKANNPDDAMDDDSENIGDDEDPRPFYERGFNRYERNKKYQLADEEWKFDSIPEIIDGRNIADFVDPDILERLDEIEREEEERVSTLENQMEDEDEDSMDEEDKAKVRAIRQRKKVVILKNRLKGTLGSTTFVPRNRQNNITIDSLEKDLGERGIDTTLVADRLRSRSQERGRKRSRSQSVALEAAGEEVANKVQRTASRSRSKTPAAVGLKNVEQQEKVEKNRKKLQKLRNRLGKKGDADNKIVDLKPKHLLSGKRSGGKTDRR